MSTVARDPQFVSSGVAAGYFLNPSDAERAINDLSASGFSKKDIGVALYDRDTPSHVRAEQFKSLFSSSERDEYSSNDAFDTLREMGLPESELGAYQNALRSGGVLVTVNAGAGRRELANSILRKDGASLPTASKNTGWTAAPSSQTAQRLTLMGEVLRVHKERVETGAVRLRKEVVAEQQTVEVPVTREEVYIERHPATGAEPVKRDFEPGKEIRVPVSEERVRAEKRPVVREEVDVRKAQVQDTEQVTDTVKHEELNVEKEGKAPVTDRKRRTG